MGNVFASSSKDTEPVFCGTPTFDPMEGFPNGRKKRVMKATEKEMVATKIHKRDRDYCAHHLLRLEQCRADNFPFVNRCKAYVHKWNDCENEDWVMRMKEYERERRLLEKRKRKMQEEAVA